MNLEKTVVLARLVKWLQAQSLDPVLQGDSSLLSVILQNDVCEWNCRILCEGPPSAIYLMSRLPAFVPADKLTATAFLLHSMNRYFHFGQFCLEAETRTISYRVRILLEDAQPPEYYFQEGVRHTLWYVKENFGFLMFFLFNSKFHHEKSEYHLRNTPNVSPGCTGKDV